MPQIHKVRYDPFRGISLFMSIEELDGGKRKVQFWTEQDQAVVQAIVDQNKAIMNDERYKAGIKAGLVEFANVPLSVKTGLFREWQRYTNRPKAKMADPDFQVWYHKKLKDPDYRYFRTAPVTI